MSLEIIWCAESFEPLKDSVDILAVGAHPDDVEMGAGGTLLRHIHEENLRAGILDLTAGERGTRGDAQIRLEEARVAARKMGAVIRLNAFREDGNLSGDPEAVPAIITAIRLLRPRIMLLPAPEDRHPDHGAASRWVRQAIFLSGLRRISTEWEGRVLSPWKPRFFAHYIQFYPLTPHLLIDISRWWDAKREVLNAYRSQFDPAFDPEHSTILSAPDFWEKFAGRFRHWGALIGTEFAEGFVLPLPLGARSLSEFFFQT